MLFLLSQSESIQQLSQPDVHNVSPVSCSNRRKTCACCDSSRKSTPPHAHVHYGTWRKRQTTSCMFSPSACLGRAHWANRCASGHQRRPRLRPLRVKVRWTEKTRIHTRWNTKKAQICFLSFSKPWAQRGLGLLTISWLILSKDQ